MIDEKLFVRNIRAMTDNDNCGAVSDGDHTFSELYRHRAILTAALFNAHPEMCWKSKRHHDGSMYDGYFIVGIDTPHGQATYHYALDYWNLFNVPELDHAPEWDEHTPEEAANRIAVTFCKSGANSLTAKVIDKSGYSPLGKWTPEFYCSHCNCRMSRRYEKKCPSCGRIVVRRQEAWHER